MAVAVAGMEGALASVVGGLIGIPVVAVPTSVGYGAAFGGLAPLLTMLNSCSANVLVVNIDSGFKGGYCAALIARRRREVVITGFGKVAVLLQRHVPGLLAAIIRRFGIKGLQEPR